MPITNPHDAIRAKMEAAGVAQPAIAAFLDAVARLQQGASGLLPEAEIEPPEDVPRYDDLPGLAADFRHLLEQLVVINLNGGLGTGMGLAGPKSLLKVRGEETFLDLLARQVLGLRKSLGSTRPAFLLMNSFSTQQASLAHLAKYPSLANPDGTLDFLQNKIPKLDPNSLLPVDWPPGPALEWCPPGHGDLYPSLLGNGNLLGRLLETGVQYLFVSNADNLGATVDLRLLGYLEERGLSFLMEVAERTYSDRKGGHLARRRSDGRLVLRESAQCPPKDEHRFHDVNRHRFFNTNNLWIRLEAVRDALEAGGGTISLPLIRNHKTLDPQDASSPAVLQLESAMGAAIECFEPSQAGAILVPRSRFAPVKTTSDLLGVRSDAYIVDAGAVVRLADARQGVPPRIDLDPEHYKLVDSFEALFPHGPPSLIDCVSLHVRGRVRFDSGILIEGEVTVRNTATEVRTLPAGTYADQVIEL